MKRSRNILILLLALCLLGSLPAMGAEERPFSLHGAGTVTFTGGPPPTGGNVTASGTATHLGQWIQDGVLNFSPSADPLLIHAVGSGTFTAADGDQLYYTIEGDLNPVTGIAIAVFTFAGGTGRFEEASGSANTVVQQDPDGAFEVTATGTIDF